MKICELKHDRIFYYVGHGAEKASVQTEKKNQAEISDKIRKKRVLKTFQDLFLIQWFLKSVCPLFQMGIS